MSRERKDITPDNIEKKVYKRLNEAPRVENKDRLLETQKGLYIRLLKMGTVKADLEKSLLEAGIDIESLKKKYLKGM